MNGLFAYDSKPMQILMKLADVIILSIMYLLFCIPVFTIGAAQSGMFTACKVFLDKEDDSSMYAAFWRGFTRGFGTVTLAWGLLTLLLLVIGYFAITAFMLGSASWAVLISVAVVAIFQTLVPAFHARFGCTWWQLIRNCWFLLFAHPLRSIATVAVIWFPLGYLLYCMYTGTIFNFISVGLVWILLYYGTAFCFATTFLRKPFQVLTEHFNLTHGLDKDGNPLPPAGETAADANESETEETVEETVEETEPAALE